MKIVITGGTGFIGQALCTTLVQGGHRVTALTRPTGQLHHRPELPVQAVEWNARDSVPWEQVLEGADAVINLAGAPIAEARWTTARKQLITDSRVITTRLLVRALSRWSSKPVTFISASGIGYYGTSDTRSLDEGAARGQGFLADLCLAWEAEALRAAEFGARVVLLRTGMVLERDGGALAKMVLPFKLFAGGPIMPGIQWVSWIHRRDHIGLIEWALANNRIAGPLNAVAPEAVTMKDFCMRLGRALRRPSWIPVPEFVLKLALGELGSMMTTGQRVTPKKAIEGGYTFQYPTLESALQTIFPDRTALGRAV